MGGHDRNSTKTMTTTTTTITIATTIANIGLSQAKSWAKLLLPRSGSLEQAQCGERGVVETILFKHCTVISAATKEALLTTKQIDLPKWTCFAIRSVTYCPKRTRGYPTCLHVGTCVVQSRDMQQFTQQPVGCLGLLDFGCLRLMVAALGQQSIS